MTSDAAPGAPVPLTPGRPLLWLARHGETEWSRNGRHTGRTDLPLTPRGEQAATALAERLGDASFDLVLTSPLQRARMTARLAGFPDALLEPAAREWDYGEYEGITTPDIRTEVPGWTVWSHGGGTRGEQPAEVGARADVVVARVRAQSQANALLFAHGHFLRVLTARWLDQGPAEGRHYKLDTATLSVLGWERDVPVIQSWNA